jgi:hypothetical protein
MLKYTFCLLVSLPFLLTGCNPPQDTKVIGVKIYEHTGSFDQLFGEWNNIGINTGFCSEELISDSEFMRQALKHDITTFVIFPVFYNPEAIAENPDIMAINSNGMQAAEDWVEFVCPSRMEYRHQVIEHARRIIREHQPDGISIDFIRHFVYWEKVYPDRDPSSLPLSCFDSVCLADFQMESGVSLPDSLTGTQERSEWILKNHEEEWNGWRCRLITSMVMEIAEAARREKPGILVNIHLVPWAKEDFNGAIKKVAGQDIFALSELTDYLSPMTYAHMVKQPPSWIHHIVEDHFMQSGGKIIPSIQVGKAYLDSELGTEEFRESVEAALQPPSGGVVLWSWEHLSAEPEKARLFKDIISTL